MFRFLAPPEEVNFWFKTHFEDYIPPCFSDANVIRRYDQYFDNIEKKQLFREKTSSAH